MLDSWLGCGLGGWFSGRLDDRLSYRPTLCGGLLGWFSLFLLFLLVVHVVFQCLDRRCGVFLKFRLCSNLYIGSMLQ